jgi:hypothetical protein
MPDEFIQFAPEATHLLATALAGQQGLVIAREVRDGVPWTVAVFEGYGTVILPDSEFAGIAPPPAPVVDDAATPENEAAPGAWGVVGSAWRWLTRS